MRKWMMMVVAVTLVAGVVALAAEKQPKKSGGSAVLDQTVKDIDGKKVALSQYAGKVLLIVNVASECGYTPQYKGLQQLHEKYAGKGLVVMGFPCNQFGGQEPGSDAEVKAFCESKYNVTFPMFSKVEVNGPGASPLFKHLTGREIAAPDRGPVKWNFEKFLVDRTGRVVGRFRSGDKPMGGPLEKAVQAALAQPAP